MIQAAVESPVFGAIASGVRRRVLDVLRDGETSVGALVDVLEMSQPAVSQHLAVLRQAGLVSERAEGRFRFYRLRPEPLRDVAQWTDRFRVFWEGRLDALGEVLDEMDEMDEMDDDDEPSPERKRKRTRKQSRR
jgi:DNA-binding transcriptional ArsR family regulator